MNIDKIHTSYAAPNAAERRILYDREKPDT